MSFSHVYVDAQTGAAGYQGDLILDGDTYEDPTTKPITTGDAANLRFMKLGSRTELDFMSGSDAGRLDWLANPVKARGFVQTVRTMSRPLARR